MRARLDGTARALLLVVGVVVLATLGGCGGSGEGPAPAPQPPAPTAPQTLALLQALLTGDQETTVVDPDARGTFVARVLDDGTIRFGAVADGDDVAEIVAAHIHEGAAGTDGPVVADLLAVASFDPATATAAGDVSVTPALAARIASQPADFYINVHTTGAPDGLARGQLGALGPASWHATLRGDEETVPVDPLARGAATFQLQGARLAVVLASANPPLTDITAAHVHLGVAGADGPILVDLDLTESGSGFTNTLESDVAAGVAVVARMLHDPTSLYVNVHTEAAPDGIARGQLGTDEIHMWSVLTGAQETTVVDPAARGGFTVRFETLTTGRVHLAVPDAQGIADVTAAHIHAGAPGVDGPILVDLRAGADYSVSAPTGSSEGAITYTQRDLTRFLADPSGFYVNFHTAAAPAGLVARPAHPDADHLRRRPARLERDHGRRPERLRIPGAGGAERVRGHLHGDHDQPPRSRPRRRSCPRRPRRHGRPRPHRPARRRGRQHVGRRDHGHGPLHGTDVRPPDRRPRGLLREHAQYGGPGRHRSRSDAACLRHDAAREPDLHIPRGLHRRHRHRRQCALEQRGRRAHVRGRARPACGAGPGRRDGAHHRHAARSRRLGPLHRDGQQRGGAATRSTSTSPSTPRPRPT